jgi:ribosomal protein S18 acetylase RimI-like enzyme
VTDLATRIRPAETAELDDAAAIIRAAYTEYAAQMTPGSWERYIEHAIDVRSRLDESELLVAESDARLVGAVTYYADARRAMGERAPSSWAGIRLLAVHPDARGRGIGRTLVEACVERARASGKAALGLHTSEMMAVAQGMYERMGFVRVPELDFHFGGDRVVMAYRLDL